MPGGYNAQARAESMARNASKMSSEAVDLREPAQKAVESVKSRARRPLETCTRKLRRQRRTCSTIAHYRDHEGR